MKINELKELRLKGYLPKSMTVLIGKKSKAIEGIEDLLAKCGGKADIIVIENKYFDIRFLHGLSVHLMQIGLLKNDLFDWVMDEMEKFNIDIFSITVKNEEKSYFPYVLINNESDNDAHIVGKLKTNLSAQWRVFQ